ncbi:MAG: BrnA antitoxin family protein [Amylibacter sp.]
MNPTKPAKTKTTLGFDADMIAWFRKLGTGYQGRMNSILRVYWHSLLSGRIKAHWNADAVAPNEHNLLEELLTKRIAQLARSTGTKVR